MVRRVLKQVVSTCDRYMTDFFCLKKALCMLQVEIPRADPLRLKVVFGKNSELEVSVHSRHSRDVIGLAIRKLAQQYQDGKLKP